MHVLMLLYNQTGKGTYWRAMGFARVLAQREYTVTVVCTSPIAKTRFSEREIDKVRIIETPDLFPGSLRSGWDLWNVIFRLSWLKGKTFDIVHAFETRPVVIWPALAAKKRGAKLFLDWCDWFGRGGSVEERPNLVIRNILRPIETFFENHYRSDADGTTVINTYLNQKAIALGVSPETIKIIRNGSNLKIKPKNCLEARKMLGLPTNMNLIGFVGGIYQQDAQFMAKAFNHLQKLNPKTRLVLVGYFNRPIEKWIINRNVIIRSGPLESNMLYTYLSACDVCWLPLCDSGANRGRWPYKLNDYMTVARPTIATEVGDLENFIKQYQIGITTPVDAKEFAYQTLELLQNPSQARALGNSARKVAETEFNWENLTTELESFYSRIGQNVHT